MESPIRDQRNGRKKESGKRAEKEREQRAREREKRAEMVMLSA